MSVEQDDHPIQHVVVLMLENRSFDQMLGDFQRLYPDLQGIPPRGPRRRNVVDGVTYEQLPTTVRCNTNDPDHGLASVLRQIGEAVPGLDKRDWFVVRFGRALWEITWSWIEYLWGKITKKAREMPPVFGAMAAYEGHFVEEYIKSFPESTVSERNEVMGYYEIDTLPALHFLARNFTVCDRWFSSVPGPTWVNRFFAHAGTARGIVRMPHSRKDLMGWALHDQPTIYDELNARRKSWRIYFHDISQTLALASQWKSENKCNYSEIENFDADAAGPASDFPAFVFIDPQYEGDDANDEHPPYDIMKGEALVARIYEGIRDNEELWQSTLLIIVYDEHGGFYDHVKPEKATPPDDCTLEFPFDRYGVRVPAILVSPWVAATDFPSDKTLCFDHTSIGKFLCERWELSPLGERMKTANSIGLALRLDAPPRTNIPKVIPTIPPAQRCHTVKANENQIALDALSLHLEELAGIEGQPRVITASASQKPDPEIVRSRVRGFLKR